MIERMLRTIYLKLLRSLQCHCTHPPYAVTADILEGDAGFLHVQHCNICGACRRTNDALNYKADWREPRPDWYTPSERKQLAVDMLATIEHEKQV